MKQLPVLRPHTFASNSQLPLLNQWPDRVLNPGPLTYESGDLPTALRGPAHKLVKGGLMEVLLGLFWYYFCSLWSAVLTLLYEVFP